MASVGAEAASEAAEAGDLAVEVGFPVEAIALSQPHVLHLVPLLDQQRHQPGRKTRESIDLPADSVAPVVSAGVCAIRIYRASSIPLARVRGRDLEIVRRSIREAESRALTSMV